MNMFQLFYSAEQNNKGHSLLQTITTTACNIMQGIASNPTAYTMFLGLLSASVAQAEQHCYTYCMMTERGQDCWQECT